MNEMKGRGIARYFGLISAVAGIVALVIYIINSNLDYYNNLSVWVIVCNVLAILGGCVLFFFSEKIGESAVASTLIEAVLVALLAVCVIVTISDRALSFAYIWFSDLDKGNADAVFALNQYVVCLAFYVVGLAAAIAAGFLELKKDKAAR